MSGSLSVPLTVASVFVPGKDYRIALASLALIALVGSCYRVWRNEHRRALEAEARLESGAAVQADLAKAQLEQLKRAGDEEQAHQRWLDGVLAELRKPGRELVLVAPGDHLHAEWALARGLINSLDTARGFAIILPAAERFPGSYEARVEAVRRSILTECTAGPGAWFNWEAQGIPLEEWEMRLSVAQELDREGLVTAKTSSDRSVVAIRITPQGSEAVRKGTF